MAAYRDRGAAFGGGSRNSEDRYKEPAPDPKQAEPIKHVQIDALVFLQIMKHCRQHAPHTVTGQLLGLDVEDTLQVTHSFGYVQRSEETSGVHEDGEQYQMETLKRLREVNVDSNTVGWYQTTHLGRMENPTMVIDTQFSYQEEIPRSVLVVYDSLQSAIGKPAFKALQLTPKFMEAYKEADSAGRQKMAEFPSNEMFMEIEVAITSSVIAEAFLIDWAISDPTDPTSQVEVLDVENQAFLEQNINLLTRSLTDLADEQLKVMNFEKMASRKGDEKGKGGRKGGAPQPKPIDTMILSQQIKTHCKAINSFAGDAFGKLYLVSNKPTGHGGQK
jgi:translation initiation factor 3 subunit H